MIEVKTFFHGWKEVTIEEAKEWAKTRYDGIMTMTDAEKEAHINSNMQGITLKELLKGGITE